MQRSCDALSDCGDKKFDTALHTAVTDGISVLQENGAFFITTNYVITPNQEQGICPEVWGISSLFLYGYKSHYGQSRFLVPIRPTSLRNVSTMPTVPLLVRRGSQKMVSTPVLATLPLAPAIFMPGVLWRKHMNPGMCFERSPYYFEMCTHSYVSIKRP